MNVRGSTPGPGRRGQVGHVGAEQLGRAIDVDEREAVLALVEDEGTAMRVLSVLGASEALADHLCRHPEHWRELRDPTLGTPAPG